MKESDLTNQPTLFGHPAGLYTLFFAEMWERFSYYGMRALLILYMTKGFLGFGDKDANAVYGAYTALVYMTPFFGGMIADRLIGSRTSVVIGGLLMAIGHLLMTVETDFFFFTALGFLITGNGFFKPNISTMVGSMYGEGSPKRDGGFTIFYIGINLGAAMAPLLCGYIGETYGWHYGFGLATFGMLVGLAVFVAPTIVTQFLILSTAVAGAVGMMFFNAGDSFSLLFNGFVTIALVISGLVAVVALQRGGLPKSAGGAPNPDTYMNNLIKVLIGTVLVIPVFVVLVSGCSILPGFDEQVMLINESQLESLEHSESKIVKGLAEFVKEGSRPAGLVLIIAGLIATVYLLKEAFSMEKVARERMFVVFILTFFMFVFWAFFEQSGSSVNNFTDRNVDRVVETSVVKAEDVGKTFQFRLVVDSEHKEVQELDFLSQEFLGHTNEHAGFAAKLEAAIRGVEAAKDESKQLDAEKLAETIGKITKHPSMTMSGLNYLRTFAKEENATAADQMVEWTFTEKSVGRVGLGGTEVPASVYQAVNPIFIMIFGLIFTAAWGFLASIGMEPSTPLKFSLGLLQLAAGFAMLYFGAQYCDDDGMIWSGWLVLMYLLLTTGELCSSPVGLSMVTKLTPTRLVSTVMGSFFLATAFSQFLAAIIAQFASVNTGGDNFIPDPVDTVNIYGDVYYMVAIMAAVMGVVCLVLSPLLKYWMHEGVKLEEEKDK